MRLKRIKSALALFWRWLVVTSLLIGCRGNEPCSHDNGIPTEDQWVQQVRFPYTAKPNRLRRVRENYSRVGVGSSKKEIIEAFGSPDFEHQFRSKVVRRGCIYEFLYYFEKPEELANELKDKRIEVFFSSAGRTTWIVGNVGLPEKGSPVQD